MTTQTKLTCTCASRYVKDAEHESDCDLWLLDEFWAGFLAWDWEMEALRPTPKNPEWVREQMSANDDMEWVNDYLQQKDERMFNGQKVEDVMLTTDAFIDRMLQNSADGLPNDDGAWSKGANGMWSKSTTYPNGSTSTTYSATPYDDDPGHGWVNDWISDRHCQTPVHMPDGLTTVHATSLSKQFEASTIPDFGLYLDGGWRPDCMAIMLPWRDYGLPAVSDAFADYAIKEAFSWAQAGAFVEVGCIGAHGRTGTVLACIAILADPELTGPEAVTFIRAAFCNHAIESAEQEWWVARFHAEHHGLPIPTKPVYVAPKATVVTAGGTSTTGTPLGGTQQDSHFGGPADPAKPGRRRNRRSKRGGKRNRSRQGVRV